MEIWIGLLGGLSSLALFAVSAVAYGLFPVFFYSLCVALGLLIGLEIPLLVRILRESQGVSQALSHVLAIDYAGALCGAVLFPLVALPYLGLSRASVVFGVMNLAVAGAGVTLLPGPRRWICLRLGAAGAILLAALAVSPRMVGFFEDILYNDHIVYTHDTPYQRIVLTRWRDDVRLFLDGNLQLSSIDEARYHEALVIPAMEAAGPPKKVLILGGGDGCAAREVLKYPSVESVTVVDIDPAITELAQQRPELVAVNQGALNAPRVTVINEDAFRFVEASRAFYGLCLRRLAAHGVLVTQATSPYYAPEVFWCIRNTITRAGTNVETGRNVETHPYHVNVPSFGEWGFVLATRDDLDTDSLEPREPTRFLNGASLRAMFALPEDLREVSGLATNELQNPVLHTYYRQGWRQFNR